ncbi:MAG TPA: hypothetical protein VJL60_00355 [Gammaproteobacteria bacterium]|nr:hypothetical protein [Gammaproteobacteria bacterium]
MIKLPSLEELKKKGTDFFQVTSQKVREQVTEVGKMIEAYKKSANDAKKKEKKSDEK